MQLGLSSYTYTWAVGVKGSMPVHPLSPYNLIDKTSSSGLKLLQIADNLPLENLETGELLELEKYSREKCVAIEMGSRGLTGDHALKCLETAGTLNSRILRMVIDGPGFEPQLQYVIDTLKDLIPEFKSRNIKLAIENHDRFKAREFERIIQSVGSEWIGICLDSVNSMGAGEGFDTVSEILLPYTINLHIKDFMITRVSHKMGFIIEGKPAGQGMLKIKDTIEKLTCMKNCESSILELWTPPEARIQDTIAKEDKWAVESINYLKSIL